MTKEQLSEKLKSGMVMDCLFRFLSGQECMIYKADRFRVGDEIIYIPDTGLNLIPLDSPVTSAEQAEEILDCCYTGNDFLQECNGNIGKAEALFWYCDWQHPSAAVHEIVFTGRTYTIIEMCPHCENEIEMQWNTDELGFKAFCPVCGKRLMLCDECRHAGCGPCDYDIETDTCRFNGKQNISDKIKEETRK